MTATDTVTAEIRAFVQRAFKGHALRDDEDIFASGHVNSLFAMELITFLENRYGIAIASEDLELENFSTVVRMAQLVERKRA